LSAFLLLPTLVVLRILLKAATGNVEVYFRTIEVRIMNINLSSNLAVGRRGVNLLSTEREDLIIFEDVCIVGYNVV
jgi:hypothetical protein